MSDVRNCRRGTCLLALMTVLDLFAMSIHKGESLSLEIEHNQSSFTFFEAILSNISFQVHDFPEENEITLYVSKNGSYQGTDNSCKLLLTQTTCNSHGICRCSATSIEGRVNYVFEKEFQIQDGGNWVFEVWNTNFTKTVHILVKAGHFATEAPQQATTKYSEYKSTATKTVTSASWRSEVANRNPVENAATVATGTPFLNQVQEGAAVQRTHQGESPNGIITVIVILSLITIVSLVFSFVVWRYPGSVLRLRRAYCLGERRDGFPDHRSTEIYDNPYCGAPDGQTSTRVKGMNPSDYLTPVLEHSGQMSEDTDSTPAASRLSSWFSARWGHPKLFSIFSGQNRPASGPDKPENIYEDVSRSPTGYIYVNPPATPHSDDGYLTPTFKPRTNGMEANEASIGEPTFPLSVPQLESCSTPSASKELNQQSSTHCREDHGMYLTPVVTPSIGKESSSSITSQHSDVPREESDEIREICCDP